MKKMHVISATTENTLRVLQRITSIFTRHRLNIEQLNVFEIEHTGVSYFTIVIHSDTKLVTKLVKQLRRIVELIEVKVSHTVPLNQEGKERLGSVDISLDRNRNH